AMKSANHDGNRTGREKEQGPTRWTEMGIFSDDCKHKQDNAEIRDDAREAKEEWKAQAIFLKERFMGEPCEASQEVAHERRMVKQDAVFIGPGQAMCFQGFRELVERNDVVRPQGRQGDADLEE